MQPAIYLSVLLAVVATPLGVLGVMPVDSKAVGQPIETQLQQTGLDTDRVLLRFDVRANGTATASVEYRFELEEANGTASFDRLQADIESNRTRYLDRFERRVTRTVGTASSTTGRPMRVTDATVRAETRQLPSPYGAVVYTFNWHGFAAVDDRGELDVGDALSGLYLDEGVQLQISWPDGYDARTVHESVTDLHDSAAIWTGPLWFGREGPRLVLSERGTATGFEVVPSVFVGLSAAFAVGGFVFWWHGRRGRNRERTGPATVRSTPANADDRTDTGQVASTSAPTDRVDPELMSNEERVVWEIRARGGRVRQQELVSALGWSDAKVSRAVGTLRDRGDIEGFRLGNENVLSLPVDDEREGEP
jgi:hypothetical protein